ncbi:MAG: Gfo/Idh/MocA family protein [Devosia sp.]
MNAPPLGLGIIGCGWAAGEIARAATFLPRLRIVAVCDTHPERAKAFAERTGARAAADIDQLLADPQVSAAYVGLPHHLLAPTVERALNAGKHVLAEKPLALSAAGAMRLGALAASRNRKLAVFFELRRSGPVGLARRLYFEGSIGKPRFVRIRTVISKRLEYWGGNGTPNWRARKSEAGGGVLLMNTIHQLDALRYVTGLDYVRATGEIGTFSAPAEVEDAASATLRLGNGALVSLTATAHSPGASHEETIEIDGELGRIDLPDPFGTAPVRLFRTADRTWNDVPTARPDSHAGMIDGFLDAIIEGRDVPAGAADAAAAFSAVAAIYRSAREGRAIDIDSLPR